MEIGKSQECQHTADGNEIKNEVAGIEGVDFHKGEFPCRFFIADTNAYRLEVIQAALFRKPIFRIQDQLLAQIRGRSPLAHKCRSLPVPVLDEFGFDPLP